MMIINLSPTGLPDERMYELEALVSGGAITINGESFDFGILQKGHILPAAAIESAHFVGPVVRHDDGVIEITLLFPIPTNASENMRFPVPIAIDSGRVVFPENTTVEEEVPEEPHVVEELGVKDD